MAIPLIVPVGLAAVGFFGGLFSGTASEIRGEVKDATDPKYRDRDAAIRNYTQHILNMGWPTELTDVLIIEATYAPANDAQSVYLHMLAEGPVIIDDMLIPINTVRNFEKVQNWLKEAASASGATSTAINAISGTNLFKDTVQESVKDAKDIVDPKKSPWPWIAGGAIAFLVLRELR